MKQPSTISLSVVLPAFNEPGIEGVVREVAARAEQLAPGASEVLVVNDGSTDSTATTIDALALQLPTVTAIHQDRNRGHGPALISGFDRARGTWIGHLDTDDQVPAGELAELWDRRRGADLVLGIRVDRDDPRHRLALTRLVRALVRLLTGRTIEDANVPCKLIHASMWRDVRPLISDDTFAPTISTVVVAARWGRVIRQVPVAHRARRRGVSTLHPGRLMRAVGLSTRQTLALHRRLTGR